MASGSQLISDWVAGLSFGDLPDDVVSATRQRVLDVIGLSIAGGQTRFGASVRASAALYPGDEARLWGTSARAATVGAAFVNGALSQALEYDDTHNESIVHMSSPSVAATLALGERQGASGRDMIRAVALGNEISARVGSVTPQQFHKRGFHPSGLFAPFGICWLAGSLLGSNTQQMTNAAGITGSFAAGLIQCWVDGTQSKFLHPGWAAQSGIAAAMLGHEGVTGPVEVFEGRFGLFASHLQAASTAPDFARLTNGLGNVWDSRNASFKPYPVAHVIHPYITAALRLRERHGLKPDEIARVICPVAPYIVGIVCEPAAEKRRPLTDSHGRVSMSYTLAEALVTGQIGRHAYARESLTDPVILALTDMVETPPDPAMPGSERFKGVVIIETKDGRRFEEVEEHNRGSAANPMSQAEIEGKFRENVAGTLSDVQADRLIAAVMRLEDLADVSALAALTVPGHD